MLMRFILQRKIYFVIFVFAVISSTWTIQEGKTQHKSCPEKCEACEQLVSKALDFLVSKQREDGSWTDGGGKVEPKKPEDKMWRGGDLYILSFTSFGGLAFLAEGSTTTKGKYSEPLKKAVEATKKYAEIGLKRDMDKSSIEGWALAIASMFLSHVYQHDKSDELKKVLETIRDYLAKRQRKEGGWDYSFFTRAIDPESKKPIKGMTFTTNNVVVASMILRYVGITIEENMFDQAIKFYTESGVQLKDGAFGYESHRVFDQTGSRGPAGRTVASLWPLKLLGLAKSETYAKASEYSENFFSELDRSQHGSAYHLLFCGLGSFYVGNPWWKKYKDAFMERISSSQKDDGSIFVKPREVTYGVLDGHESYGIKFDKIYMTSIYAIVLQLHKGNLILDKLKPLKE